MENEIKTGGVASEGYMGGTAWTGCNAGRQYWHYAQVNKIVKKEFKRRFPDVRVSCRGSSFSGGQDCRGTIHMRVEDAFIPFDEYMKKAEREGYFPSCSWYRYNGRDYYCEDPALTWPQRREAVYRSTIAHANNYGVDVKRIDGFLEFALTDKAKAAARYLAALYDSFNQTDINSMVDYFDVLFYEFIELKTEEE